MDDDLPTWQCGSFDQLMEQAFTVMPLDTAQWYVDTLLPYRDALRRGEGTKLITIKVWHDLLTTFFMLLPVPNYHQFGFLIMLERAPFMAEQQQPLEGPNALNDMVWRAATLLCALREKKRETLSNVLPDEVIAGFKQTKQPIDDLWKVRRFRLSDNKEWVGEKAAYAKRQDASHHKALSVTIAQGPSVLILDIDAEATPADVADQLRRVLATRSEADQGEPTREQQLDQPAASDGQGEAYCKLTYVLRTELMAALGGDGAWHEVWDAVQDTDFALALFPQVRGSDRCPEDPRQGAITYLQSAIDGGIVGDKHTLCVLGDGDACFAWDHALMDGAPAAWLSSQVVELANTYGQPPSTSGTATSSDPAAADSPVSLREVATPSPAEWSAGVRAAVAAGHQLCHDRTTSPSYVTKHMRIEACGRRQAREKGLSADATFQAALQLALAEIGHPDLLHVAEVVSMRHYRWGRSTNMSGNSAAMDAFVAAARAAACAERGNAPADKPATTTPSTPSFSSASASASTSALRARAAVLLRGAARVHKERIKAHKRNPVVFANFLAGFGEAAMREEGAQKDAATATEAHAQQSSGKAQGGDESFNLPARCIELFGEIQQQPNRAPGSRSLMMDSVVISNAPAWPGVAVFTTTPSAPLVVSYIVRDNEVELDVISRCADTPVTVPDWLVEQGKVDGSKSEGTLMDVFPAVLERAFHHVDQLLALL